MVDDPQERLRVEIPRGLSGRLDKVLAQMVPEGAGLSRSRLQSLIAQGRVIGPGGPAQARAQTSPGDVWEIDLPPPEPLDVLPEAMALDILYEDDDLIVVNKSAGLVVHPAPGTPTGTLVNGLLAHCGDSLSGVGGVARPGIVHRIDKDTSGLLVVAKSDVAHQGLAAQFAAHTVERAYLAFCWGVPSLADPRLMGLPGVSADGARIKIDAPLGRHPTDRKRMAVRKEGRHARTRITIEEAYGPVARITCRLETGRTHQIRAHLAHVGHPLVGDPVYGRARQTGPDEAQSFPRQALHAQSLGFEHPTRGETLHFETKPPQDIKD
ncbi:MAG: RluA family pseudouridine synthase, partial [Pseudomonadota bacterium]